MTNVRLFLTYSISPMWPFLLSALDSMSKGTFNPFPPGSSAALIAPILAGTFLSIVTALHLHPNGVRGPAASAYVPKSDQLSLFALVLLVGLVMPGFASAQTPQDPPAPVVVELPACSSVVCVRPGLGFAGTAWDFYSHSIVRSYQLSGLVELRTRAVPLVGLALGGAYQTGQVEGWGATALCTLPDNWSIGGTGIFSSSHRPAWSIAAGRAFFGG